MNSIAPNDELQLIDNQADDQIDDQQPIRPHLNLTVAQIPLSRASLGWYKSGVPLGMFPPMDIPDEIAERIPQKPPRNRSKIGRK